MSLVAVCVKDEILRRALCHMIIRMGHRTVNRAEDAEITVREDSDGSLTVITPTGDPFSLAIVFLPLYLLYELSICIVRDKTTE